MGKGNRKGKSNDVIAAFKHMSPEVKATYALRCEQRRPRLPDLLVDTHLGKVSHWDLSSDGLPLSYDAFVATLARKFDWELEEVAEKGFRQYGPALRNEFGQTIFHADVGAITKKVKFPRRATCWQAHPGLCKHKHANVYDKALDLGHNLNHALIALGAEQRWAKLYLQAGEDDEPMAQTHFYVAHVRKANPSIALLVHAIVSGNVISLAEEVDRYVSF
jgi:hypothetical protein